MQMLQLRKDVNVYNEATGFVITSGSFNGCTPKDFKGKGWVKQIEAGTFLPVELVQDDSITFRVIVNDDLTAQENGEWTDKLTYKLHIPDGKLVLSGGREILEGEDMSDYTREIEVEPGSYQIELYTTFGGVNGDYALAKAGIDEEEIPEYFERTHPGVKMPGWMAEWLDLEDEDEGYEDDDDDDDEQEEQSGKRESWDVWEEDEEDEEAPSDPEPAGIDFILRLTPLEGEPPMPKLDGGWCRIDQNPRIPEKCPLGLFSTNVEGVHDRQPYEQTNLTYRAQVAKHVAGIERVPIKGGPVDIDVEEMVLPYWFAWMCRDGVFAQVRLETQGRSLDIEWPTLKAGFAVEQTSDGYVIDLEGNNAKWTNIGRLHRLGHLLTDLPDGVVLSLDTSEELQDDDFEDDERLAGFHRYRGEVRSGKWFIAESYPAATADELRDIFQLAREVDKGDPITMRSQEEIDSVLANAKKNDFLLRNKMPVANGLTLQAADLTLTAFLGNWVIRERYSGRFPMISLDEGLDEWDAAMDKLTEAFAAVHTDPNVVFAGVSGNFHKTDMSTHKAMTPEAVRKHDDAMVMQRMIPIGDIVSERISDVVIRGYVHVTEPIYGAMNRNAFGFGSSDLFSRFSDGWSLTTSTMPGSDQPKKKIYRQGGSDDLAELMRLHLAKLEQLSAKHGKPKAIRADLQGLAEAVDAYLVKELELVAQ